MLLYNYWHFIQFLHYGHNVFFSTTAHYVTSVLSSGANTLLTQCMHGVYTHQRHQFSEI